MTPTIKSIQKRVAQEFGVRVTEMKSERRARRVSHPRQVAMYLCHRLTSQSYPAIGGAFGGRDHTTVMHAKGAVEERMERDPELRKIVRALERELGHQIRATTAKHDLSQIQLEAASAATRDFKNGEFSELAGRAEDLATALQETFNELPAAAGQIHDGRDITLFASETGTWTIMVTEHQTATLVMHGEAWGDKERVLTPLRPDVAALKSRDADDAPRSRKCITCGYSLQITLI